MEEWITLHKAELADNWQRARTGQPLNYIAPSLVYKMNSYLGDNWLDDVTGLEQLTALTELYRVFSSV